MQLLNVAIAGWLDGWAVIIILLIDWVLPSCLQMPLNIEPN